MRLICGLDPFMRSRMSAVIREEGEYGHWARAAAAPCEAARGV
jgi:hypothetical protein